MKLYFLMVFACIAFIFAGCAAPGQPLDPQQQAAHDTYCVAKALYCAQPSVGLSEEAMTAKTVYCTVNAVCLPPPVAASAPTK